MIPPLSRGRCAGRGQAQQSLPACRYSGHGSPLPRMVALRAHLLDSCPPVRGSHHGAPLGDEATAQQSGSPRTWLHRVPAHPTEQAPPATLGDRGASGRSGRRRRAGSRPPSARYGPCSRAGAVTPPAPHGHATAAAHPGAAHLAKHDSGATVPAPAPSCAPLPGGAHPYLMCVEGMCCAGFRLICRFTFDTPPLPPAARRRLTLGPLRSHAVTLRRAGRRQRARRRVVRFLFP